MRVGTYAWGILLALGASSAGFAACGGNVQVAATGTGGHSSGTGGATSTNVQVSSNDATSTTSTTTVSSTAGTGGATTSSTSGGTGGAATGCVQECGQVQQCFGFDACKQFGIDCSMLNPQADCVILCITAANPTCNNLQTVATGCFGGCMNMGGDAGTDAGGSDGGGSDAGMMGATCQQCALQKCQAQAFACGTNAGCMAWLNCVGACSPQDAMCVPNCDIANAGAKSLFDPLYACTCTNCDVECAAESPCSHVGPDAGP